MYYKKIKYLFDELPMIFIGVLMIVLKGFFLETNIEKLDRTGYMTEYESLTYIYNTNYPTISSYSSGIQYTSFSFYSRCITYICIIAHIFLRYRNEPYILRTLGSFLFLCLSHAGGYYTERPIHYFFVLNFLSLTCYFKRRSPLFIIYTVSTWSMYVIGLIINIPNVNIIEYIAFLASFYA
jgi:hypothetical protein